MTVSLTFTNEVNNSILKLYDIIGATAAPYGNSLSANGDQTSSSTTLAGPTFTPSVIGLVIAGNGTGFSQLNSVTVNNGTPYFDCAFTPTTSTAITAGDLESPTLDEDEGFGHLYNTNLSSITWTWVNMTNPSAYSVAGGFWAAAAVAYAGVQPTPGYRSSSALHIGARDQFRKILG
jgi:hypothetical protein